MSTFFIQGFILELNIINFFEKNIDTSYKKYDKIPLQGIKGGNYYEKKITYRWNELWTLC